MNIPPGPNYWISVARIELEDGNEYGCWLNLLLSVWEDLL